MKFWAVLGSQGCREKKLPTAISMQLFWVVFSTFCGQKKFKKKTFMKTFLCNSFFDHKKLKKPPSKVAQKFLLFSLLP